MRMLGLDFGEKRIGLAQSDELHLLAESIGFIERRSDQQAIRDIQNLAHRLGVKTVVAGLPKHMNGEEGVQAKKVRSFAERLKEKCSLELVYWDERLTTREAERALLSRDFSRRKRRLRRDAAASEIMLQSYLDFLNEGAKRKYV